MAISTHSNGDAQARPNNTDRRLHAIGHGQCEQIDAKTALAVATESQLETTCHIDTSMSAEFTAGDKVMVTPDGYSAEQVEGELAILTEQEIAIKRSNEQIGDVMVHFPRLNYRVEKI